MIKLKVKARRRKHCIVDVKVVSPHYFHACGSSFAAFFVIGCLIRMSHFQSSLLLYLMWTSLANLTSIRDAVVY